MRVYFDSNIFRYLKPSYQEFETKESFNNIIEKLLEYLVIPYSDAHLEDLSRNVKFPEKNHEDFDVMSRVCKNLYFRSDYNKDLKILIQPPSFSYEAKGYSSMSNEGIYESFNSLINELKPDPSNQILIETLENLLKIELPAFIDNDTYNSLDLDSRNAVDKYMPGARNSTSIEEFMKSKFFSSGLIQDSLPEFTEFRKYAHDKIDSAKYGYSAIGMDFNEKLKESPFQQTFDSLLKFVIPEDQAYDQYYKFWLGYLFLDLLNIKRDENSKGVFKKVSFNNMSTDAHHAYFGSFCDWFITDDHALQIKAKILYSLYNIPCRVGGHKDFIDYFSNYSVLSDLQSFRSYFYSEASKLVNKKNCVSINEHLISTNQLSNIFMFYFNRIQYNHDTATFTFYWDNFSEASRYFIYQEADILIKQLTNIFREDVHEKGPMISDEYEMVNEYLRVYQTTDLLVGLIRHNYAQGSSLFLDIVFIKQKD